MSSPATPAISVRKLTKSFGAVIVPRGVDVATRAEIYRLIRQLRAQGAGILIVSSDTEDLLAVCDRIAVVIGGVLSAVQPAEEMQLADLEALV